VQRRAAVRGVGQRRMRRGLSVRWPRRVLVLVPPGRGQCRPAVAARRHRRASGWPTM